MLERVWRKGNPLTLVVAILMQSLRRTVQRFLKKTKIRITIWPCNATPRHIPWENHNSKRYMHPSVDCSTIYNSQDKEVIETSINWGMDKEDVGYIHNGILLIHKKERNYVTCRHVDGVRECYPEWSKSEREKQISYINVDMWNTKKVYMVSLAKQK